MSQRLPVDRRAFLAGSAGAMGAAVFGGVPLGLLAEQGAPPAAQGWDSGQVRHLLRRRRCASAPRMSPGA